MWISVREHIIEERKFELHTSNCTSGKVVLQLIRRDVKVSFFLFPKKVTELLCFDTDKKIKKSHWSTEIKKAAEEMKSGLKVPKWGYWSFGAIALSILLAVFVGFYSEIKHMKQFQNSFMAQNSQQQKLILEKLDRGDLIATMYKVYMITAIDDKNVVLIENENLGKPENYTEGLTNEEYPKESFIGDEIKVLKVMFVTGRISNSETILNIVDN